MLGRIFLCTSWIGLALSQTQGNTVAEIQQNATYTGLEGCDALLDAGLGAIIVVPGQSAYEDSRNTFYSLDNRLLEPSCIVQPVTTNQVSQVLKTLRGAAGSADWDVGVRSGGHTDFNNNAVYHGVSIDLSNFNQVELTTKSGSPWTQGPAKWTGQSSITNAVARIRPAARWGDVIEQLEPFGISVTGGRSGNVGVGGLLLSGGASYHIQQWGLSCDNVVNYEIVLSDGRIIQANSQQNWELFRALKGGGNNIGIVTRFDLRTFTIPPQGAYGGLVFSPFQAIDANIRQFVNYVKSIGISGSADHQFFNYRSDATGATSLMNMLASTDGNPNSTAFADFGSKIDVSSDRRALQPLSQLANSISDKGGSYYQSATLTIQATEVMMKKSAEIFNKLLTDLKAHGSPATVNWVHQPFPKMLASVNPNGNVLGLEQSLRSNQILWEGRATTTVSDGPSKNAVTKRLLMQATEELRKFSASQQNHCPYIYMNYASPTQNVLESYGAFSVAYLRLIAATYDQLGFFQKRVPGGWKISRIPLF